MTQRALLIGSATGGLIGPNNDVATMSALLAGRGFDVKTRIDKDATRKGILDGYAELIGATTEGDGALVYYSGHGNLTIDSSPAATTSFQNIVPFDYFEGDDQDYRGISAEELSLLLRKLVTKSKNATVILDCCHSSQMSRDGAVQDAVARALPHPTRVSIDKHLATMRALYPNVNVPVEGNTDAVRFVACAREQVAYEYTNAKTGKRTGAFTEAVADVFSEVGLDAPISWGVLARAIRERVLRLFPTQRPDIDGPVGRQLFRLNDLDDDKGIVAISKADDEYKIDAGKIQSVSVGDVYNIVPVADRKNTVAHATVTEVRATTSIVTIDKELPKNPIAISAKRAAPLRPVTVIASADQLPTISKAFANASTIRIATNDDGDLTLAILRSTDNVFTIEDKRGVIYPGTPILADAVANLANLAVAQSLRELVGEHGLPSNQIEVELGLIEDGNKRPIASSGTSISCGDAIYCRVANKSQNPLFIHAFSVGLRGKVTLLSNNERLAQGEELFVGNRRDTPPKGLKPGWPKGLPQTVPGIDSILVFATTSPANLSMLTTMDVGVRGGLGTRGEMRPLQQLLDQIQIGGTRDTNAAADDDLFLVRKVSWVLYPRTLPMSSKEFVVDDAPRGLGASRAAEAWVPTKPAAPGRIAVRLQKLVIDDTHAWLPADVRVDALVCTRSRPEDGGYHPTTATFSRIRDGQTLPLDNALIYEGPVRDFVDIYLWVTRDKAPTKALADLLADRVKSPEMKDALAALLVGAGAVAAPWIAAVGASAVIAHAAYEVISAFAGNAIGLYRTSFLAKENYGVGLYPAQGLYRAQDFSFSLLIDPTDPAQ